MKILLDPNVFMIQKFGGISRLYSELWKHYKQIKDIQVHCPLIYSNNLHLAELELAKKNWLSKLMQNDFRGKFRLQLLLNRLMYGKTKQFLNQKKVDVFVPTYYDPYFISSLGPIPFVLTVYDMIHELLPQYFLHDKTTVSQKRELILKATYIVAISQQTKNDILRIYPDIDANKIQVVHLAQSIDTEAYIKATVLNEKYILFIGNRKGYKNFSFMIRAIAPLLIKYKKQLLCAGGNFFDTDELELIKELTVEKYVSQKSFADSELPYLYKNALAFIFPSQYEGFGIPLLEAMKCRCPVLASDIGCFREVAQDAAIYFDLNDTQSLSKQLELLMNDPLLQTNMVSKGNKRVNEFSWEKTSGKYLEVLQKCLNG